MSARGLADPAVINAVVGAPAPPSGGDTGMPLGYPRVADCLAYLRADLEHWTQVYARSELSGRAAGLAEQNLAAKAANLAYWSNTVSIELGHAEGDPCWMFVHRVDGVRQGPGEVAGFGDFRVLIPGAQARAEAWGAVVWPVDGSDWIGGHQ